MVRDLLKECILAGESASSPIQFSRKHSVKLYAPSPAFSSVGSTASNSTRHTSSSIDPKNVAPYSVAVMSFSMDSILHSGPSSSANIVSPRAGPVNSIPTPAGLRIYHPPSSANQGERTAESSGSIPRLSMSGSSVPVSQTAGMSSGGPYFPIGVNQPPIQGSATGSGGLNPWPWNPYLWNPLVAMQQFPGGNTQVLSWPPVQGDQVLPNFLALATSKGKGRKRRGEEETPWPKRPRYYEEVDSTFVISDSDSEEEFGEDLAEPFDPNSFYKKSPKVDVPEAIESSLRKYFQSNLETTARRSMAREDPLPDIPALRCPRADDVIADFMGKDFPSKIDSQYRRMQTAVLASAAPAINLWINLDQQQLTLGQGGLVPVDVVLGVIQRSLVLVGNASNYISQMRRDIIIRKLEDRNRGLARTLRSICKSRQPEGDLLFGSTVHKALSDRAETVSALQKAAAKVDVRGSGGSVKKFFRGDPALDHGRGSGKYPRPFFQKPLGSNANSSRIFRTQQHSQPSKQQKRPYYATKNQPNTKNQ